jgi:hypothetical protein
VTRSKHGREPRWRRNRGSGSPSHRTDRRANGNGDGDDGGDHPTSRRASRHSERWTRHSESPSAEQPDDQPVEQPTEQRTERPSERPSEPRIEHRGERRRPEPHHIVADIEPLDVDGVRTVAIGSVAWIVAFVAMLPFIGTLRDHDRLSWLWICIAGFGLGLIGVEYCRRRRNVLTSEPGRRRATTSQFGAAGD